MKPLSVAHAPSITMKTFTYAVLKLLCIFEANLNFMHLWQQIQSCLFEEIYCYFNLIWSWNLFIYCIIILQVSQKNGVSQTVPENVNRSEHEHVLTLDKNLVFILKYYKTVIQIGKLSTKWFLQTMINSWMNNICRYWY